MMMLSGNLMSTTVKRTWLSHFLFLKIEVAEQWFRMDKISPLQFQPRVSRAFPDVVGRISIVSNNPLL